MPDYVYFNHQAHVTAGVSCVSCHGRIDQMIEVKQMKPLNMGMCLECHRDPAPNIRPAELVTKLDWVPDRDPREIGREIIAQKHISPQPIARVSSMSLITIKGSTPRAGAERAAGNAAESPATTQPAPALRAKTILAQSGPARRHAGISRLAASRIQRQCDGNAGGGVAPQRAQDYGGVVRTRRSGRVPPSDRSHSAVREGR